MIATSSQRAPNPPAAYARNETLIQPQPVASVLAAFGSARCAVPWNPIYGTTVRTRVNTQNVAQSSALLEDWHLGKSYRICKPSSSAGAAVNLARRLALTRSTLA